LARFKVVVSDQVFPSVDTERSMLTEIDAELEVAEGDVEQVLLVASDADAILNTYLPWDEPALARLDHCRIIARYGIGVDNIDLEAARRHDIVVTNVPDYSVEEVAVHALGLLLAALRRLPTAQKMVAEGRWGIDGVRPIRRLSLLTVGLLGYGRIGRRLGSFLEVVGTNFIVHDPYLRPDVAGPPLVGFEELLETADIISIHAPLTPDTRSMIDTAAIALMRPGAILINTSRGPLVDLDAVTAALSEGRLGGAALDVFDAEPLDADRIAGVPNLVATPHMAYYSEEALAESQRKAATQVIKVLTGEPPDYQVN
jgi:D-3-phosphoglycerate dehydrogenase